MASRYGPAAAHVPGSSRFAASSTLSTRWRCGSITRPRARGLSRGQAGKSPGPVVHADQHHRCDRRLVGVVVLAGVLEDLLHGAGGAGRKTIPAEADLRAGSPHAGRCGSTSRSRSRTGWPARARSATSGSRGSSRPSGQVAQDVAGGVDPRIDRRPERRRAPPSSLQRLADRRLRLAGQVGAEVGRLHGAGARHRSRRRGALRQHGRSGRRRRTPGHPAPARARP